MRRALAGAALAACLSPAAAHGWGPDGHVAVAAVAQQRLSPEARALVEEVAGGTPISDEGLASWPDRHRSPETRPWHYVNIPFGSSYDPARDCPRRACAVAALEGARVALESARGRDERLLALRWLVHLVADLHQPVHAGDGFDRGGNELRVRFGARREPTNLHEVMDEETVAAVTQGRPPADVARALAASLDPARARAWAAELRPAAWANESSREAQAIYAGLGATPQTREIVSIPRGWAEAERPRTEAALLRAGVRLAAVLDAVARRAR